MKSERPVIHIVEHWALPPDAGRQHIAARGFDVRVHEPWRGGGLPGLIGVEAGVMIMGGPQMVSEHETWPYLADEFGFIEQAMRHDVPLIGVCLGSQMIAHVLGATVDYAADPQALSMGLYDTRATAGGTALLPERLMTLNGNAQGWSLPHGATLLATSDETIHRNQAFAYGDTVLALQFHPEVTPEILEIWKRDFGTLFGRPGTQSEAETDAGFARHDAALKVWYRGLLDRWFAQDSRLT